MRVHLLEQRQIVLAKAVGSLQRGVGRLAQQFQHIARIAQAGFKQFALDAQHAPVAQRAPVRHIPGAGDDFELWEMLPDHVGDFQRLLHVIDRQHQHFGAGRTRRAQQIEPGRVAVKHPVAEAAHRFYFFGVVIQHGGGDALRQQHASDDLAVAAKTGNDDRRFLRLGDFRQRWLLGPGLRVARQQQLVHGHQQQRADEHRQRHRANQQRSHFVGKNIGARRRLEHDKGKFAALGQQQRKHRALLIRQLHRAGQRVDGSEFQAQKTDHDQQHVDRKFAQHAKVNAHADGHEKQAQQQRLERLQIGFQRAAVFAVGQQHAGQKSAQRHRQADPLHQRSNADHQQQRGGGENLRGAAVGNPAQQRTQQQSPAQNDARNGGDDAQRFKQPVRMGDGRVFAADGCQQRHQRQNRNRRHVLKQQNRKTGLAAGRAHQVALADGLKRNRGRGQGQTQRGHQRRRPFDAASYANAGQQRGATEQLHAAPAENRATQAPQAVRFEFQAN